MTRFTVTAWCDRPFYAKCEVEAETPHNALAKARTAIDDAPAEECDQGYYWDEWTVDSDERSDVLTHLDGAARLRVAAPKLLEACELLVRYWEQPVGHGARLQKAVESAIAAIAEATDDSIGRVA